MSAGRQSTVFDIKTEARRLSHGIKLKAAAFSLLPAAAFAGFLTSLLLGALCAVYGPAAVFGDDAFGAWFARAVPAGLAAPLLFFFSALFLLFFAALRFTLQALFYYRTDRNQTRPKCFISLKTGVKLTYCAALLAVKKLGWYALLGLPGAFSGAATYLLLRKGLPYALLLCGAGLTLTQLLTGAAAAWLICRRYYLTGYLLYLNPLMGVREAVGSSVLLTRGEIGKIALCCLSALPWHALRFFSVTRPFAFAYTNLLRAVTCEAVFAEDKTRAGVPAVQFFINRGTKILPAE